MNSSTHSEYSIDQVLHVGRFSTVQRATRRETGDSVVLKTCSTPYPGADDVARVHNEWRILCELDSPLIITAQGLEEVDGRPVLVLDDDRAPTLRSQCGVPMEVGVFFQVAKKLCLALMVVHERGFVHRDIKPDNILFDPQTKRLLLLDFNVAMRPSAGDSKAALVAGTLPYMAPEQTGRTGSPVDERTDLYAVGVTLYELLTGRLPFVHTDALKLIHQHLTATPPRIRSLAPDVPETACVIVERLLAKNPEQRYQSPGGLLHDLELAERLWLNGDHEGAARFLPGTRDVAHRLHVSGGLYGREAAREQLQSTLREVRSGGVALLTLAGAGGSGKSMLMRDFRARSVARKGLWAPGKCAELRSSVRKPILEGVRQLLQSLLALDERAVASWSELISSALAPGGGALLPVLPELALFLGESSEPTELDLVAASNRFRDTLRKLVQCLARPGQPLVLFLDDVHWADPATLEMLEALLCDPQADNLLVVAAYRPEVMASDGAVSLRLDSLRAAVADAGGLHRHIELGDLSVGDVATLLAESLHQSREQVMPLATAVHDKTHGNPFFVHQFIHALGRQQLLRLDREQLIWRWDLQAIAAAEITDNVVELLLARLRGMRPDVQRVLQGAAGLGAGCQLASLQAIFPDMSASALAEAILVPLREGLLTTDAATERYLDAICAGAYGESAAEASGEAHLHFLHDRVLEATSGLIPEGELPALHLRIGRHLRSKLDLESGARELADVVQHYRLGLQLENLRSTVAIEERVVVAGLALRAAIDARAANAYRAGLDHARFGTGLLGEDAWAQHYDLAAGLAFVEVECLSLAGEHEQVTTRCRALSSRMHTLEEKAALHDLLIRQCISDAAFAAGLSVIHEQLRLFGLEFPESDQAAQDGIGAELGVIMTALGADPAAAMRALPAADERRHHLVTAAFMALFQIGYLSGQGGFATLGTMRAVSYSLQHGQTRSSDYAFGMLGFFLTHFFGQWDLGLVVGATARELAARNPWDGERALAGIAILTTLTHWRQPVAKVTAELPGITALAESTGAYLALGYSVGARAEVGMCSGRELSAIQRELPSLIASLQRVRGAMMRPNFHGTIWAIATLTGQPIAVLEEGDQGAQTGSRVTARLRCALHLARPQAEVAELVSSLPRVLEQTPGFVSVWEATFSCALHCLWLAEATRESDESASAAHQASARTHTDQVRDWCERGNPNLQHKSSLLQAEWARFEGRKLEALQGYSQALRGAAAADHPGDEALIAERAAGLYRELGMADLAVHHISRARAAYGRWGAWAKVEQLDRHAVTRARFSTGLSSTMQSGTRSTDALSMAALDNASLVAASLAIANEIRMPRLLDVLIRVLMENAGADRMAVIMGRDDQFSVVAEARSYDDISVHDGEPLPLAEWQHGLRSVVYYVQRTLAVEVVGDAREHARYGSDGYVRDHGVRSLLALPIERQGHLLAVLYLENRAVPNSFTRDHVSLLRVLAGQIATSLEHARLYGELEQAMRELAVSERLKHEFLATVSHELRTPLNAIINMPQVLLEGLPDALPASAALGLDEIRDLLGTVQQCGRQLLGRIEQMILFSRLQAGSLPFLPTEIDIAVPIADAVTALAGDASHRNITVDVDTAASDGLALSGDTRLLGHVVRNLLSNAIKFSPVGSQVTLTTRTSDAGIELAVCDSGPGIASESRELVFESFRQSSVGSKRSHGGTGLGLTITRELLQLHGGAVLVDPDSSDGCTFIVQLPR